MEKYRNVADSLTVEIRVARARSFLGAAVGVQ